MRELVEVAPGVLLATSRRMSTTSTVLVGAGECFLVDPSWLPDELTALADELATRRLVVTGGFATHAHHDHLLWHPGFGSAPRWASHTTAGLARSEREALTAALAEFPAALTELMGRVTGVDRIPDESLPDGIEVELVIHYGHAPGHTALWLPEQRVLIAGDMLSDHELPLPFYPDDLAAYLVALDSLAPFVAKAAHLIPGHGTPTRKPMARLDADRRYLDDVIRGRHPDDARIANPGMAEEFAHLQRLVREQGSGAR